MESPEISFKRWLKQKTIDKHNFRVKQENQKKHMKNNENQYEVLILFHY